MKYSSNCIILLHLEEEDKENDQISEVLIHCTITTNLMKHGSS